MQPDYDDIDLTASSAVFEGTVIFLAIPNSGEMVSKQAGKRNKKRGKQISFKSCSESSS